MIYEEIYEFRSMFCFGVLYLNYYWICFICSIVNIFVPSFSALKLLPWLLIYLNEFTNEAVSFPSAKLIESFLRKAEFPGY